MCNRKLIAKWSDAAVYDEYQKQMLSRRAYNYNYKYVCSMYRTYYLMPKAYVVTYTYIIIVDCHVQYSSPSGNYNYSH